MAAPKNVTETEAADPVAARGGPPSGYRNALLEEKRGYEQKLSAAESEKDKKLWGDHVHGVDAELKRIGGGEAKAPAKRAESRG